MNRRTLLQGTALTLVGGILAACQSVTTPTVTPAEIITTAQNIGPALLNALTLTAPNALSASQVTTINGYLSDATSLGSKLLPDITATQSAPTVKQIETDINDVITFAAAIPLIPPPFSTALAAASVALPLLEGFLNSVLPATAAASPAALAARQKAAALAPPMTLDQAKATLAHYATRQTNN